MLKLPNSIDPAVMAENIVHLRDAESSLDGRVSDLEATAPKNYSTTETATGQKWIDGRDIYMRYYEVPIGEEATSVVCNLTNCEIINIDGGLLSLNGSYYPLSFRTSDALRNQAYYYAPNDILFVYGATTLLGGKVRVIIYYVKKPAPGRAPEDEPEEVKEPEEKKTTKKKTTK